MVQKRTTLIVVACVVVAVMLAAGGYCAYKWHVAEIARAEIAEQLKTATEAKDVALAGKAAAEAAKSKAESARDGAIKGVQQESAGIKRDRAELAELKGREEQVARQSRELAERMQADQSLRSQCSGYTFDIQGGGEARRLRDLLDGLGVKGVTLRIKGPTRRGGGENWEEVKSQK